MGGGGGRGSQPVLAAILLSTLWLGCGLFRPFHRHCSSEPYLSRARLWMYANHVPTSTVSLENACCVCMWARVDLCVHRRLCRCHFEAHCFRFWKNWSNIDGGTALGYVALARTLTDHYVIGYNEDVMKYQLARPLKVHFRKYNFQWKQILCLLRAFLQLHPCLLDETIQQTSSFHVKIYGTVKEFFAQSVELTWFSHSQDALYASWHGILSDVLW